MELKGKTISSLMLGQGALNSSLYLCQVMHQRLQPKPHRLAYDVFMFYLDLDEIGTLEKRMFFFSRNRFNLYSFFDKDHLPGNSNSLKENILDYLRSNGIDLPEGRVLLLTYLRTVGYIFNPVSFYFCFDSAGDFSCVIAEVGNTFGEMKPYLIRKQEILGSDVYGKIEKKHFYVSPFMDLGIDFEFVLKIPREEIKIMVNDINKGERVLLASLTGRRVELNNWNLFKLTLLYPLITLKVISWIHWNALLLYLKRTPHYSKNENILDQRGICYPFRRIS